MPKLPRLTAAEAESMLVKAGFVWLRSKGSHRIYSKGGRRVVFRFMGTSRCTQRLSSKPLKHWTT